jgi:hypothetical protein
MEPTMSSVRINSQTSSSLGISSSNKSNPLDDLNDNRGDALFSELKESGFSESESRLIVKEFQGNLKKGGGAVDETTAMRSALKLAGVTDETKIQSALDALSRVQQQDDDSSSTKTRESMQYTNSFSG